MMNGQKYHINKSVLAIQSSGGRPVPVTIPTGASVIIESGKLDGTHMVDVNWEGKTVMMFATDLRERGTLLERSK